MRLDFIKMHGAGNDYIYFDCHTFAKLEFIEKLQRKKDVTFSRKSNQKAFFTRFRVKTLRKLCQQVDTDDFSPLSKNRNLLLYMIDTIKAKRLCWVVANRGFFVHCTKTTMCRARRSEALDLREI